MASYLIDVHLRDTATGDTKVWRGNSYQDPADEFNPFWWVDGNGGCDCNRSAYFGGTELACNMREPRIALDRIVRVSDGKIVYDAREHE